MDRRAFIGSLAGGLLAAPLGAEAQAEKIYRIGYLRVGQPLKAFLEAVRQGLRERGYVEGRNVVIEFRYSDSGGSFELARLAEELLVRLKVDVILASGAQAALAAKNVTATVPMVFLGVVDPVAVGLVASLARPGGNITGLTVTSADLAGKRLEQLRELVPNLRRVGALWDRENPTNLVQLKEVEVAARKLDMQLALAPVRGPNDFDSAFKALRGADGLLVVDTPLFIAHRARLTELAGRNRLPAIYGFREFVDVGGLMSYGPSITDLHRRATIYVDKILKGAKPADLPVEQPTTFEFFINLKTAKALGLTIPPSLLQRADQVIE